jgi:Fe-S-cluster containining protein
MIHRGDAEHAEKYAWGRALSLNLSISDWKHLLKMLKTPGDGHTTTAVCYPVGRMEQSSLQEIVEAAAGRAEVRDAVGRLYADVQRQIDLRRPLCVVSGRCCRFEEFGHRLFVTTIELAAFLHELERSRKERPISGAQWDGSGCPFQVNKLCGVHTIRPFGCRMFFCDATATIWQNETYERFHAELKLLHETLDVPYRYLEWRAALRELGLADDKTQHAGV